MDNNFDEILKTIIDYIPKLKNGILETAEYFQIYEENKGAIRLCEIIDGLEWLSESLVLMSKLNKEEVDEINNKLTEINNALENGDYILVGDLLQYEFMPILENIEGSLISQ